MDEPIYTQLGGIELLCLISHTHLITESGYHRVWGKLDNLEVLRGGCGICWWCGMYGYYHILAIYDHQIVCKCGNHAMYNDAFTIVLYSHLV